MVCVDVAYSTAYRDLNYDVRAGVLNRIGDRICLPTFI